MKWGAPCYTHGGKHVVGVAGFRDYFALWFHQGAALKDDAGVLINAQEGKTKALRQWRMERKRDIKAAIIKRYVKESIANFDAGNVIPKQRTKTPIEIPKELQNAMRRTKGATAAFKALSPSCRREYANYIAEAKRDATKLRRIEKILPMILNGGGLNDRYR